MRDVVPRASDAERFLRFAYVAKAFVHGVLAAVVIALLLDVTGIVGEAGLVPWIAGTPWSQFLLGSAAVGLGGYAVWRWMEAVRDPLARGWLARLGYAASGLAYAALAVETISLLMAAETSGAPPRDLTALLADTPAGSWVLASFGLAAAIFGAFQIHRGVTQRFMLALQVPQLDPRYERAARSLGATGIASRGVVLLLVGALLTVGAVRLADAGLGPLVQALALASWGPGLLLVVALGLLSYTAYCLFRGAYRSIPATSG